LAERWSVRIAINILTFIFMTRKSSIVEHPLKNPERLPRRRWLWRIIVGILAFVLLAVINDFLPESHPANVLTPSPTPRSDASFFYVQSLPTWGTLTVDGQTVQTLPTPGTGSPLLLTRGQHQIHWQAEPFQPFQCTLHVPPTQQTARDCQTRQNLYSWNNNPTFFLRIPVSLDTLPATERAALLQATQATLDSRQITETISPGDHYAYSQNPTNVLTAQQPLLMSTRLLLQTDKKLPARCPDLSLGQECTIAGQDCRAFCNLDQWPLNQSDKPQWNIAALINETWHYTTTDGKSLAPDTTTPSVETRRDQFVTLQVLWHSGRWSVAFYADGSSTFDDPTCITLVGTITSQSNYGQPYKTSQTVNWAYASHPTATSSCLAAGFVRANASAPLPTTPSLLLLRHAGVLLSANTSTHQIWPALPVASEHEQLLANDLVKQAVV
jgi:hypothetical protein